MKLLDRCAHIPVRSARRLARRVRATALWLRGRRGPPWREPTIEERFDDIFHFNGWACAESLSGPGSSLAATARIRHALPGLVQEIGARSILDIPCGDHHWMQHVPLDVDRYIGADIVAGLIEQNRQRFATDRKTFLQLDLTRDPLPAVDLVFCRDCLVHLSLAQIQLALKNVVASGAKFLLTTHFPGIDRNADIATGKWRPLDFCQAPFCLPPPLRILHEDQPPGGAAAKTMALWAPRK
jgi:hypothetical protein